MIPARCPACRSKKGSSRELPPIDDQPGRKFIKCKTCQTLRFETEGPSLSNRKGSSRLGSKELPGRDYAMATMGIEILGQGQVDILWWEPGCSEDYFRISSIPLVRNVTIWDVASLCGAPVEDLVKKPTPESADLVICNEVIHRLPSPVRSWKRALRALRPGGLLVCSTSLYSGRLAKRGGYLQHPETRVFWSYEGIRALADRHGFDVDVRVPEIAYRKNIKRKRYVFLSQSPAMQRNIRRYFGDTFLAPSETT